MLLYTVQEAEECVIVSSDDAVVATEHCVRNVAPGPMRWDTPSFPLSAHPRSESRFRKNKQKNQLGVMTLGQSCFPLKEK